MIEPSNDLIEARRRYTRFLSICAVLVLAVLVAARDVLLPFVLALVLSYVLTPLVAWVEHRRVRRGYAVLLVYVVVLSSMGLLIRIGAPRVGQELVNLKRELPSLARTVRDEWVPAVQHRLRAAGLAGPEPKTPEPERPQEVVSSEPHDPATPSHEGRHRLRGEGDGERPEIIVRPRPDGSFAVDFHAPLAVTPGKDGGYTIEPQHDLAEGSFDVDRMVADVAGKSVAYAQRNALEIVKIGRDIIAGVSRGFFVFGITLMLAAYTMLTRETILGFFESLLRPSSRPSFRELLVRIDRGLSGVVRGQLIICVVNGVLSAIGFAIVGLKYWPVLALLATVFSLIPIFGSIISSIPAVILGLTQSFGTAAFVLAWILGIHQLEANFLNPKIMGDAAKIHPVLVIFSLLVGEHLFHVVGALLAVPCMSIAQSVFTHVRKGIQMRDPEMAHEPVGSLPPPPPLSSSKLAND